LEYGQRLFTERRNRLYSASQRNIAGFLHAASLAGGAQALGQKIGRIEPGYSADLVVLDARNPLLADAKGDDILGRYLFGGDKRMIRDVMVAGDWVVQDGRHPNEIEAGRAFAAAVQGLFD
jgi:formimidoylglutamate deiminase